mmetsp:Transcript_34357/g.52638  ORF Transcript_34357/g.52638 Transcript_34357/m.52638 type:complete len:228 (-) Transcript_34357:2510-3193(-)
MFAKAMDFNKHIKCVEQLEKCIDNQQSQVLEVLDVLFKWANLRLNESSNTKLALSIFDFFSALIKLCMEQEYQLQDFEAVVLLGTLCDKSGVNQKVLQEKVRKLIRMCYEIYDKKSCFKVLIDQGVKSKNLKSVAECLDEIADFIVHNGVNMITKKDFALFVEKADSPDKSVREAALKVFAEAYVVLGEQIWTLIKGMPLKVKDLLESRFKQVNKKTGGMNSSLNVS